MKQQLQLTGYFERDVATVAKHLSTMRGGDDEQLAYGWLSELDSERRGGSRVTTARRVIGSMVKHYNGDEFNFTEGAALVTVLEWLYYRKEAKP